MKVIGCFMISFKDDPNHEYPFLLHDDHSIVPDVENHFKLDKSVFFNYLADPDFYNVRFIQYMDKDKIISSGSREDIISWLVCNDPNGIYTDNDCKNEGMEPLSLEEARSLMIEIKERN